MEFPFTVDFLEFEINVIEKDLKVQDASKVGPLQDLPHDEQHISVHSSSRAIVLGLLKVGFKQLFLRDENSRLCQVRPLCVLDFYVHHSRQRQGCGRRLFDQMTQTENVTANQLAIDQPSEKMLAFMERHYGLAKPQRQSNHFAVFPGFFNTSVEQPRPPEQVRARVRRPHSYDSSLVGRCCVKSGDIPLNTGSRRSAAWIGLVVTGLSQRAALGKSTVAAKLVLVSDMSMVYGRLLSQHPWTRDSNERLAEHVDRTNADK